MKTDGRQERLRLRPGGTLRGALSVPGDKSISHRAVMLASLAHGTSRIGNWLAAGDTEATLNAMLALDADVERHDETTLTIRGGALRQAAQPLDLKNAGTGIRLLAGIMVGAAFSQRSGWQRAAAAPPDEARHGATAADGR